MNSTIPNFTKPQVQKLKYCEIQFRFLSLFANVVLSKKNSKQIEVFVLQCLMENEISKVMEVARHPVWISPTHFIGGLVQA